MKTKLYIILAFIVILSSGCSSKAEPSSIATAVLELTPEPTLELAPEIPEHLLKINIYSNAIAENQVEDSAERTIMVSLPPSYYSCEKNYPVVIFLEGYCTSLSLNTMYLKYNEQMMQEGNNEFIIVNIDGINKYLGSFYTNSPITGNWENFVLDEVLSYVDDNFRTIQNRESRGISGFSMGGSGAINIAFKNSDIFSSVYAASAGILAPEGLKSATNSWDATFKRGYGRAFAPVTDNPERQTYYPQFDGSEEDAKVIADWETGFGNMPEKIEYLLNSSYELKAIRLDVDTKDTFTWLAEGNKYLSQLLYENNIEHIYVENNAGHSLSQDFADRDFVEFFSSNLVFED